jgi:hypothetical protein
VTYDKTQITGLCNPGATAVELQQRKALDNLLPALYVGVNSYDVGILGSVLKQVAALGSLVSDSETSVELRGKSDPWSTTALQDGYVTMRIEVIDGVEYVTEVAADLWRSLLRSEAPFAPPFGLSLQHLVTLAQQLPHLRKFKGRIQLYAEDGINTTSSSAQLPSGLPAAAPRLTVLDLSGNRLTGQLPVDWSSWSSIQDLDLTYNKLTGSLPDSWGQAARMPPNLQMDFRFNADLSGTVPPSWVHFGSGSIMVDGTSIGGCMPAGLSGTLPSCAPLDQAAKAAPLLELKKLLMHRGATSSALSDWTNGERQYKHAHCPTCTA